MIFTIFAITTGSGWYVANEVLHKSYTATGEMQIKPRGVVDVPSFIIGPTEKTEDMTAFQSEFEIIQSPDLLLPIINDLGLDKTWAKRGKSDEDSLPPVESLAIMNSILRLDLKRGTNIVVITVESEVPKEAADIVNAVMDHYQTLRDVEEDQRNSRGADALRDQITQQQAVVDKSTAGVEKLRQQLGNTGVNIVPGSYGSEERDEQDLDSRKHDLLSAKEDADTRRVLLEQVQSLNDDDLINTLDALGRSEPNISSLRAQSLQVDGEIDNFLKQGFDENHPRILALRAEQARRKQQIADLIKGLRSAMVVDSQMAKSRVDLLTKEVDDLQAKVTLDQSSYLTPFRDAQRDLQKQQDLLDALTIRLKQLLADRPLLESPVRIIDRAVPPTSPTKPNKNTYLMISAAIGLFVGIVIAFLIEYLDTSVKTMADAEVLLGLPVLTVIPNKGGPMPLTQESARMPHAEGYRILRAKLDLRVQNGIGPSLATLSGGPGEGKTTTIYNLAIVCAQAGQSVILIDGDLRRPMLHQLLNLPNDRGLANYLRGEGDAVDYIQQSDLPKLHLLAAGDMPMSDIGVLAGDKIRLMLDDLKQRYDLVLIDSPPVLGISDGSIIAREADYVILVIQHRRYPREISLRAKRAIEEVHGNCIGMVLNCVSVKSDDSYYYYSNYGDYYYNRKKEKADRGKKHLGSVKANGKPGKPAIAATRKAERQSDEF
ncbi:MAG: polysaccharide biosynthesis tyrosine autokinase [Methylacidiphilales bacterium]|nr:polysaccharide biosynthesis tyrosine autokinase [Candidatus Methylacidiphilales bacterium]